MTRRSLISLAVLGSLAVLAGAFLFQFAGFAPCQLCLWQRWPHAAAIAIGIIALVSSERPAQIWCWLGALAALATAGIGGYHSGVERKLWAGLDSCSGPGLTGDLLSVEGPALVACDEIPFEIFGITMANMNLVGSLVFAAIWIWAARR